MSNETNGEFELAIGGTPYRFKVGTGAIIAAQEQIGKEDGGRIPSLPELLDGVKAMRRMLYVRTFLWAGLRKYHANLTVADVEGMLDQIQEDEARALILGLAASTVPDGRDIAAVQATGPPTDPPRALAERPRVRSNGRARSTSKRAGSA